MKGKAMPKERDEIVTHTIVPAQPGWFLCIRWPQGENEDAVWNEEPIIAWEIERSANVAQPYRVDHSATPITADPGGAGDIHSQEWAIKRPDGGYYTRGGDRCEMQSELNEYYDQFRTWVEKSPNDERKLKWP
jgi:hypothetical protein